MHEQDCLTAILGSGALRCWVTQLKLLEKLQWKQPQQFLSGLLAHCQLLQLLCQ